jgi:hypothetical protein
LFPDINKGQFIKEVYFGLEILCGTEMKGQLQMVVSERDRLGHSACLP